MRNVRHTRGMTSAEVRQYMFDKEFPNATLPEHEPEPTFHYRVTFTVTVDYYARTEIEAVNGARNMIADKLSIPVTGLGNGTAYEGDMKRIGVLEASLLDPGDSDIPVDNKGETK